MRNTINSLKEIKLFKLYFKIINRLIQFFHIMRQPQIMKCKPEYIS